MASKERFFIPDTIKVGYQNRTDTFTGKLGYVVYYDKAGVLRKEKSWSGWRDASLGETDYTNEPTSGFVINKSVGGGSRGWDHRMYYCRVYDPRGFEFEITIDNFMFILEHCDCTSGKVLSGRFVYSWLGTDLVLLPEDCPEYSESSAASKKMMSTKLKATDLIPGSLYKADYAIPYYISNYDQAMKDDCRVIFVGLVKFQKELGKRYETRCLFYNPWGETVFSMNPKNLLFLVSENYIPESKCSEVIELFKKTAISYEFWNTPGIVARFSTDSELLTSRRDEQNIYNRYFNGYYKFSKLPDDAGITVNLFSRYLKLYSNTPSSYGGNVRRDPDAVYHKYSLTLDPITSELQVIKELDLGKPKKCYHSYYRLSTAPKMSDLYPDASSEDIDKLGIHHQEWTTAEKGYLVYVTADGLWSESLQILLAQDNFGDPGFILPQAVEIPLPTKL